MTRRDPGEELQDAMSAEYIDVDEGVLSELLYTAEERGIFANGISTDDAIRIGQILNIAKSCKKSCPEKYQM